MILEIIIAVAIGIIAGIFTGLIPGIHINLVALFLFIYSSYFLGYFSVIALICFIVSMSISHSFFDFIPSIFLSAPNDETALSVLPGHKMLMKGEGYSAIKLALEGCYLGILILIVVTPLSIIFMPLIYSFLSKYMFIVLILASLFLIISDKNKFLALFIFLISGFLGISTLNLPLNQALLPLLTGLFGTSMLIISIQQKTIVPEQKILSIDIEKKEKINLLSTGIISSTLCGFLPGLGASQAAVIGTSLKGKTDSKGFIFLLGVISTLVTAFNFIAIYAIGKPRSGTAVVVSKLIDSFSLTTLSIVIVSMIISGGVCFYLSIIAAKIVSKRINKINYSKISYFIILLLFLICFLISGWVGIIVLITSTSLGIFAQLKGVRKMHLMGCIMLPVILYYL